MMHRLAREYLSRTLFTGKRRQIVERINEMFNIVWDASDIPECKIKDEGISGVNLVMLFKNQRERHTIVPASKIEET